MYPLLVRASYKPLTLVMGLVTYVGNISWIPFGHKSGELQKLATRLSFFQNVAKSQGAIYRAL